MTTIPSIMTGFFARKFESSYPKLGESQYTEKIINNMDEGERHINFVSIYQQYFINIVILFASTIFLGIYSMISSTNQSVGLIILIILFVYNAFGHLFKVRKFYKS